MHMHMHTQRLDQEPHPSHLCMLRVRADFKCSGGRIQVVGELSLEQTVSLGENVLPY